MTYCSAHTPRLQHQQAIRRRGACEFLKTCFFLKSDPHIFSSCFSTFGVPIFFCFGPCYLRLEIIDSCRWLNTHLGKIYLGCALQLNQVFETTVGELFASCWWWQTSLPFRSRPCTAVPKTTFYQALVEIGQAGLNVASKLVLVTRRNDNSDSHSCWEEKRRHLKLTFPTLQGKKWS